MNAQQAIKTLGDAMEKLSCLGNGERRGNSIGNDIASAALDATAIVQATLEAAVSAVWHSAIEGESDLCNAEIAIRAIDKQSIIDGMCK